MFSTTHDMVSRSKKQSLGKLESFVRAQFEILEMEKRSEFSDPFEAPYFRPQHSLALSHVVSS